MAEEKREEANKEPEKKERTFWYDNFDENDMSVEYVVDHVIDKEALAGYLKEARGNRKMNEFAELCETKPNPSTFSRILTYKITRPLKPILVQDIIKHAVPSFNVSYYTFMNANGMSPKIEVEDKKRRFEKRKERIPDLKEEEPFSQTRSRVKNRILEELTMRGCVMIPLKRIPTEGMLTEGMAEQMPLIPKGAFSLVYSSHFALYMPSEKPVYWNFVIARIPDFIKHRAKEFFDDNVRTFLRDAWEPETLKDVKTSFVFWDNEEDYAEIKAILMDRELNSQMSLIYLSQDSSRDPVEWMIPVKGMGEQKQSLFEKPKMAIFGEEDEDVDEDGDMDIFGGNHDVK